MRGTLAPPGPTIPRLRTLQGPVLHAIFPHFGLSVLTPTHTPHTPPSTIQCMKGHSALMQHLWEPPGNPDSDIDIDIDIRNPHGATASPPPPPTHTHTQNPPTHPPPNTTHHPHGAPSNQHSHYGWLSVTFHAFLLCRVTVRSYSICGSPVYRGILISGMRTGQQHCIWQQLAATMQL